DRLQEAGLRGWYVTDLSELADLDPSSDILIFAPGAAGPAAGADDMPTVGREQESAALISEFLNAGGRVLVLEQTSLEGLPVSAALVPHASTMTFPLAWDHPVLRGIGPDDLKFWRGDHYVTRWEVRRPTEHGARALAVSGGNEHLDQAPIVELRAGGGTVLLCQALVAEKLDAEPVARRLLRNALHYLADTEPTGAATVVVSDQEAFEGSLRELGVDFRTVDALQAPAVAGTPLVILHGGGERVERSVPRLRAHLSNGATVYWHAPDPDAFARLAGEVGLEGLRIGPAQGPVSIARRQHELLAGVSREDLYFTGPVRSWMRDADIDPTVADRAVEPDVPTGEMHSIPLADLSLEGTYVDLTDEGISFATNGTATGDLDVGDAGFYVLVLRLSGTPSQGGLPVASVRVDGREVASVGLTQQEPRDYPLLLELPAGTSRLTVAFVNDLFVGGEDRNMMLRGLAVTGRPWKPQGLEMPVQPAVLAVVQAGAGRLVLDGVRWDTNAANRTKGYRYASGLLANLGATFDRAEPAPVWIPGGRFEPVGQIAYSRKQPDQFAIFSAGAYAATFRCLADGSYNVLIRGRSTPAGGVFANAAVSVDGELVHEVNLHSSSDRVYRVGTLRLTAGLHTVTVEFTNDRTIDGEDRNLFVRDVGFRSNR
ncbi:MAG: hypothetical protein AMK73_08315, partial [Planctomycetes bacterium SM23_32]